MIYQLKLVLALCAFSGITGELDFGDLMPWIVDIDFEQCVINAATEFIELVEKCQRKYLKEISENKPLEIKFSENNVQLDFHLGLKTMFCVQDKILTEDEDNHLRQCFVGCAEKIEGLFKTDDFPVAFNHAADCTIRGLMEFCEPPGAEE